jgi:hypothetical protein
MWMTQILMWMTQIPEYLGFTHEYFGHPHEYFGPQHRIVWSPTPVGRGAAVLFQSPTAVPSFCPRARSGFSGRHFVFTTNIRYVEKIDDVGKTCHCIYIIYNLIIC